MNSFSIHLIANFGNINANVLKKQLREKQLSFREISLGVKTLKIYKTRPSSQRPQLVKRFQDSIFWKKNKKSIKLGSKRFKL
jgi:hypothetical protein